LRGDLPRSRFLQRDIRLLEAVFGVRRVWWDEHGRWLRLNSWPLPAGPSRYNVRTTDVLLMVPPAYGEAEGSGTGLEEFYVRPDLQVWRGDAWSDLPHSFSTLDRRDGRALQAGWRYLCLHTFWNPRRDTAITAMTQLSLVLADPWAFERLANRNGRGHA
jgi:hypothetical protein